MSKSCNTCKHLCKSICLKLEDETLYSIWCGAKQNMQEIECKEYIYHEEIKNEKSNNKRRINRVS